MPDFSLSRKAPHLLEQAQTLIQELEHELRTERAEKQQLARMLEAAQTELAHANERHVREVLVGDHERQGMQEAIAVMIREVCKVAGEHGLAARIAG